MSHIKIQTNRIQSQSTRTQWVGEKKKKMKIYSNTQKSCCCGERSRAARHVAPSSSVTNLLKCSLMIIVVHGGVNGWRGEACVALLKLHKKKKLPFFHSINYIIEPSRRFLISIKCRVIKSALHSILLNGSDPTSSSTYINSKWQTTREIVNFLLGLDRSHCESRFPFRARFIVTILLLLLLFGFTQKKKRVSWNMRKIGIHKKHKFEIPEKHLAHICTALQRGFFLLIFIFIIRLSSAWDST